MREGRGIEEGREGHTHTPPFLHTYTSIYMCAQAHTHKHTHRNHTCLTAGIWCLAAMLAISSGVDSGSCTVGKCKKTTLDESIDFVREIMHTQRITQHLCMLLT